MHTFQSDSTAGVSLTLGGCTAGLGPGTYCTFSIISFFKFHWITVVKILLCKVYWSTIAAQRRRNKDDHMSPDCGALPWPLQRKTYWFHSFFFSSFNSFLFGSSFWENIWFCSSIERLACIQPCIFTPLSSGLNLQGFFVRKVWTNKRVVRYRESVLCSLSHSTLSKGILGNVPDTSDLLLISEVREVLSKT